VAGLTISASTSFAHDFWTSVVHRGVERSAGEEVRIARITAFVVGMISIAIAILLGPGANVAFLVGLAFAVAASANLPAIVLSLFWKRFNTAGAVSGLGIGLASSIGLILMSPAVQGKEAIFPLENPGIVSIPLGFLAAVAGTLMSNDPSSQDKFVELSVRANTGLGAEKPVAH
jgi:cation/acetate symporter